jgi:hypothetical protein
VRGPEQIGMQGAAAVPDGQHNKFDRHSTPSTGSATEAPSGGLLAASA